MNNNKLTVLAGFYSRKGWDLGMEVRSGPVACPTCHRRLLWNFGNMRVFAAHGAVSRVQLAPCPVLKDGISAVPGRRVDLAYILTPTGHRLLAFIANMLAGLSACQLSCPLFVFCAVNTTHSMYPRYVPNIVPKHHYLHTSCAALKRVER